ncbi:molybdopterin-guanine dinucleotide biosynthesis protein B [Bacillus sp. SCS-151]|uniref:molybdopterin-guanine dinucleotide biosynthesis protein B n=1 Tax=Nanhaiella sioensis TaxID=3115293 RepID=UPI0039796278
MAVVNTPVILQIVGYQNSGKTTLVERFVHESVKQGLKVGTIKHHGHGGKPKANDVGKDTYRHRQAGAVITGVEGEGTVHIHIENDETSLKQLLHMYNPFGLDIIFVEGYKQAQFPKIVLLRSVEDIHLCNELTNVLAIIKWFDHHQFDEIPYKVFNIGEHEKYIPTILQNVRRRHGQ